MTIYFTAAISQKNQYGEYYDKIVKVLEQQGHTVIHDHITDVSLNQIAIASEETRNEYYLKVLKWIAKADVIVAELSFPSTLNVGHEVTLALNKGKPVVGLYFKDKQSVFFQGLQSDKFIYQPYTSEDLEPTIISALDYSQEISDTRFNFFISPSLSHYLDWISSTKKIPRSVYLRQLIEEDREKNKEHYES